MKRKLLAISMVLALMLAAGSAVAQCTVGAYANADGTGNVIIPQFEGNSAEFSVYVVLYAENFVNAVAYGLTVPGLNQDMFQQGFVPFGPFSDSAVNGETLEVRTGLGGCFLGFGGVPMLVAQHDFLVFSPNTLSRSLTIRPDSREAAGQGLFPIYSTCQSVLIPCQNVDLQVGTPIATESASWGAVKNLYNN